MSKLDEVRAHPATVVFNSRADAKHIATLLAFWHRRGEKPSSISELIRLSLETFSSMLVTNNMAEFVATQKEAFEVMERAGIMNQKMRTLNKRNLADAIAQEVVNTDGIQGIEPIKAIRTKATPAPGNPKFDTALAAMEKSMSTEVQNQINKAKENTAEFSKSLGIVPEEG